jgi:pimeloyl-ACP methyl ester carboxylesterase/DNA-binding SARP family transcriptional activator
MGSVPPTRYARSRDVSLAYQDFGDGPATLVAVPPLAQNIEIAWDRPQYRHYFERLANFSRYVHFDKRGTGASDRTVPVPSLDMRVDDLRAVMDAAGIDRAFIWGASEGGTTALLFAVTYPDRVAGLILDGSAAYLAPPTEETAAREQRLALRELWLDRWGTDESLTLDIMAPSIASDVGYRAWQPRYERQSASPAALRDLIQMIDEVDVTAVLPQIKAPTLARHHVDDAVVSIEWARDTVAAIPGARLIEYAGGDHFTHIGEDLDDWLGLLQEFTTGTRPPDRELPAAGPLHRESEATRIRTLGGFSVIVGDEEVALSAWGSRRARQLCKRLAAACGRPVPREQLIELLWANEAGEGRLSARLSVQLSTVRRILGGGVIADRASVRLDLHEVQLDVDDLERAAEAGNLARVLELYQGEFLPEDAYEDWAAPARERARLAYVRAARELAMVAMAIGDHQRAADLARRMLTTDQFDEEGHRRLIAALVAGGRLSEARLAYASYADRMDELGVPRAPLDELVPVEG